jgi:hypothetical protein
MGDRPGGVVSDVALLVAVFLAATGIAALLGAANFGTALTFGQIAFAATLVLVIVRR